MDTLEKFARALYDANATDGVQDEWEKRTDAVKDMWRNLARVAVKAMRDITLPDDVRYKGYKSGRAMYEAIIDAMLEEK